jgi:hypothetical protein
MSSVRLTSEARRVLKALADEGGRIEGRRVVPYPHTFRLVTPGTLGDSSTIHPNAVHALVEGGLIKASPLDPPLCDKINYAITDAGRREVRHRRVNIAEPEPQLFDETRP